MPRFRKLQPPKHASQCHGGRRDRCIRVATLDAVRVQDSRYGKQFVRAERKFNPLKINKHLEDGCAVDRSELSLEVARVCCSIVQA
eukprot:8332450-Alexandrium_andersonii.AAC.1